MIADHTASQHCSADYLVISDCCEIASPAVFEILGPMHIESISLTFQGHISHVIIRFPIKHFIFACLDSFSLRRTIYGRQTSRQTDGHNIVA